MTLTRRAALAAYVFALVLATSARSAAQPGPTYNWIPTGAGSFNWNDPGNWTGLGAPPNFAVATANLTSALTDNQTITSTSSITINRLNIGNANFSYLVQFGGGRTLTFTTDGAIGNDAPDLIMNAGSLTQTFDTGVVLSAGNTLTITQNSAAGALVVSQAISGTGNLVKVGAGDLVLTGVGTNTGATAINQGRVVLQGGDNRLSTGTAVTLANTAGVVLVLDDVNQSLASLSGGGATGGNVQIVGTRALTVGGANTSTTYAGAVTGAGGSLVKVGTGTLTLTGANTYAGGTVVNAGTLSVNADARLGAVPGAPAAGNVTLGNGGTLATTATFTLDANRGVQLGATGANDTTSTINVTTGTLTYGGVLAGGGTNNALTKAGAGTLALTAANTYTGRTRIDAGTLSIDADDRLGAVPGAATPGHLTIGNATLQTTAGFTLDANRGVQLGATGAAGTSSTINTTGGNISYGGVITGGGTNNALVKAAAGDLVLTGASTYGGGTTINAGRVVLQGGDNRLPTTTVVTLADVAGATLYLNTVNQAIGGLNGGGTNGGDVDILGVRALVVNGGGTFNGAILGAGGRLVKGGGGTLTLGGANTYGGTTFIAGGTLSISADTHLGTAPAVAALHLGVGDGATLQATAGFTLDVKRGIQLGIAGANDTTSTVAVTTGTLTFDGIIGDGGTNNALTKAGAGVLALGGSSFYTGRTTVAGGTLSVNGDAALGAAPAAATPGHLTVGDGATFATSSAFTLNSNRGIQLGAAGASNTTSTISTGANLTYGGVIAGGGTDNRLVKGGAGDLTLTGVSTYGGTLTTIAGGRLVLRGGDNRLPTTTGVLLDGPAGTQLVLDNVSQTLLGGLGGVAGSVDIIGTQTLTVGNGNFGGAILGSGGSLVLAGGSLFLTGTSTYGGSTTITGPGVLTINGDAALGAAPAAATPGHLTIGDGATFRTFQTAFTLDANRGIRLGAVGASNTTSTINTGTNLTYGGAVTGGGTGSALVKLGDGDLILSGASIYGGTTTISGGRIVVTGANNRLPTTTTVTLANAGGVGLAVDGVAQTIAGLSGGGAAGGHIDLVGGAAALTVDGGGLFAGNVAGAGSFVKQGAGTLTLTGAATHTGGTTVSAGVLQVGNGGTTGSVDGAVVNNASLVFNRSNALAPGAISGSGSVTKLGGGLLTLSGANTYAGPTTLTGGTLSIATDGGLGAAPGTATAGHLVLGHGTVLATTEAFTLSASRGVQLGATGFNDSASMIRTDANLTYGGVIAGGGTGNALVKAGAGDLTLTGASTYGGATTISAGRVLLQGSGRLPTTTGLTLANAAGVGLVVDGLSQDIGSLNGGGSAGGNVELPNGGNLRVNGGGSFGGTVAGTGVLLKDGANTLVLTGAATHTGGTIVSAGTLQIGAGGTTGSVAGDITNAGTVVFNRSNDLTYAGAVGGAGTVVKTGAGVLTLTGANTHATTRIDQGALVLGASNALPSTGTVRLNGGALSTGTAGQSANAGTLAMDASSTVALGTSAHTLTFAGLAASPTGTLTVTGWTGNHYQPGEGGKIVFADAAGITQAFLDNVQFAGYPVGGALIDLGGGSAELVPVPEPATVLGVAALALVGLRAVRRRRAALAGL